MSNAKGPSESKVRPSATPSEFHEFSQLKPILLEHRPHNETPPTLPPSLSPASPSHIHISNRNGPKPLRATTPPVAKERHEKAVHILGPSGAHDSLFLEQHLSPDPMSEAGQELIGMYSNDKCKPVGFVSLLGGQETNTKDPSSFINQRLIIGQILGPFRDTLISMYVLRPYMQAETDTGPSYRYTQKIHPAFPIEDKAVFFQSNLSDGLICAVYSTSLIYWKNTHALSSHPCPDLKFVRHLAGGALQDEFASPRLSTVAAGLVFLTGRPVTSIIETSMTVGRVVALAHSLGLNRDPTNWKIPQHHKRLRVRLWWCLIIHDTWSSFSRGIPAHILSTQHDVPIPSLAAHIPVANESEDDILAAQGFVLLCELTVVVREMMMITYDLSPKTQDDISKKLRKHEVSLDLWEESFSNWKETQSLRGSNEVTGSSSLTLEFLTIKMFLSRIALHESSKAEAPQSLEIRQYYQLHCRKAAHNVVEFMAGLSKLNFGEFWLPYAASHLTVCATLLLRCALETDDNEAARSCMWDVRKLQTVLKAARDDYEWELGETCLDHCENLISRAKHTNIELENTDDNETIRQSFQSDIDHRDILDGFSNDELWGAAVFMNTAPWDTLDAQMGYNSFFDITTADGNLTWG
ncbi:hypothetical protein BP6252_01803 [Coleophoma cylindrospora]|uniref:Xylanolytic transcriptional activator regulatory domain-containing protein n=1 Tax=Coleophoma cylindrospora TaxID=1849047 RepID=A0A3D8SUB5_9HELO|nr:hypothetical protein BP6252_01803 [Coleophoma cylindrospora]